MLKKDKITLVDGLRDELKDVKCFYMFQFSGISVPEDNALRMKIRETGSTYRVVKNRLLAKATEGTALEPLASGLKHTTVVAYSKEDPVELAKVLADFGKGRKFSDIWRSREYEQFRKQHIEGRIPEICKFCYA